MLFYYRFLNDTFICHIIDFKLSYEGHGAYLPALAEPLALFYAPIIASCEAIHLTFLICSFKEVFFKTVELSRYQYAQEV